ARRLPPRRRGNESGPGSAYCLWQDQHGGRWRPLPLAQVQRTPNEPAAAVTLVVQRPASASALVFLFAPTGRRSGTLQQRIALRAGLPILAAGGAEILLPL